MYHNSKSKNHIPNISFTVNSDLCIGCGICENVCPTHSISFDTKDGIEKPLIHNYSCNNSKGCHRCYDICPGLGIKIKERSSQLFNISTTDDPQIGSYIACYTGYSNIQENRLKSASGGMVSQFLVWLLENKKIDGAIVSVFDKDKSFKVKTIIATNKEDILSSRGSKYGPVSYQGIVRKLRDSKGSRYVIVGLPCHIHGFRKLIDRDRSIREKVVGFFSLFCSGSQNFYYTEYILSKLNINLDQLQYLSYREGNPSGLVASDNTNNVFIDYKSYNVPLKSTFYPHRCLLCVDMFGELSDISFGDIHVDNEQEAGEGISAIIARNEYWNKLLEEAEKTGAICLHDISIDRLLYKRPMAYIKKRRNSSFVRLLKKMGKPYPIYDSNNSAKITFKIVLNYIVMRIRGYIGMHKTLWFLLPKINRK